MTIIKIADVLQKSVPQIQTDPLVPTIFHEAWWLDITTQGRCQVVEVKENGRVVGRLPFMLRKKYGFVLADMPPLTHFIGPAIIEGAGKSNNRFLKRLDITRELIAKLPETSSFYIKCHRDVSDVIAFQASGFRSSVQFTHEVLPQPIDDVWKGMRDKGRNGIRLARDYASTMDSLEPGDFISLYQNNLENRGDGSYIDMNLAEMLVTKCIDLKRGAIFSAMDKNGKLTSAIFCVWDDSSYYYLMSTRTSDSHRGAISLLLWEAISDAMRRGLIFDFDGMATEGSARLAANFTPTVTPRYVATRESGAWRVLRSIKSLRGEQNHFCG